MKTSVIRYRVADFLKQHPPFDVLPEEDLLELAGTGRVTFHESEEYLFRKGQARDALIRVIQQGKVEVVEERTEGERVRDVLGEGDILGLDRSFRSESYSHAAKTASDVILYSVDARAFEDLVNKHEKMSQYIAAHFPGARVTWLDAAVPPPELLQRTTCDSGISIREVAARMTDGACTVVDAQGRPLGLITDREIRDCVALSVSIEAPCETIMNSRIPAVPSGLGTTEYILEMMRARSQHLWITEGGSFCGLMRDADLALAGGRNPVLLMQSMLAARSPRELALLRRYRDELLLESLGSPDDVDRCALVARELDDAFVETAIRLAQDEIGDGGLNLPYCWVLFGRTGRAECLAAEPPSIELVYADPPEAEELAASEYFTALFEAVRHQFPGKESSPPHSRSLSGWKEFYGELIRDPILNGIYSVRSMFDFRPVLGEDALAGALEEFVRTELKTAQVFVPVLANDTLANLPPMTFFRGLVVALDGRERNTLDIESYALQPVEDAARVFALASGHVSPTNTIERLEKAPNEVLEETREAFRVAAFHCAIARLKNQGNTVIDPSRLSKYDQRLLKSAFQSIRRLLELTASKFVGATQL